MGNSAAFRLAPLSTVVPTAARRTSEMRVEPSDRRTSLPMICGAIRVERSETVVLHRFYHLWRLVVHDRPPLSLIGSEHYHCPTGRGVSTVQHSQAGVERSETVGLSGLKARSPVSDKKKRPEGGWNGTDGRPGRG
jgi:hypothetical protein